MSSNIYDELILLKKKFDKYQENLKNSKNFNTVLDLYQLYIGPKLIKNEIEYEMIRAANRGKTKCKLLILKSLIPINEEILNFLLIFITKQIQHIFKSSKFKIISTPELTFYISWEDSMNLI